MRARNPLTPCFCCKSNSSSIKKLLASPDYRIQVIVASCCPFSASPTPCFFRFLGGATRHNIPGTNSLTAAKILMARYSCKPQYTDGASLRTSSEVSASTCWVLSLGQVLDGLSRLFPVNLTGRNLENRNLAFVRVVIEQDNRGKGFRLAGDRLTSFAGSRRKGLTIPGSRDWHYGFIQLFFPKK